jgi:hypothetical protein
MRPSGAHGKTAEFSNQCDVGRKSHGIGVSARVGEVGRTRSGEFGRSVPVVMNLTPIKRKVGKYRGVGSNCYCYCMETDDLGALGF